MLAAFLNISNHQTFQSARHTLNFFKALYLQTNIGQDQRKLFWCFIRLNVLLQPLIRDLHVLELINDKDRKRYEL